MEKYKDEALLRKKYINDGLSVHEIAKDFNVRGGTIHYWLRIFNIKTRTLSESLKGKRNPFFGKKHSDKNKQKTKEATRARVLGQCGVNNNNWKGGRREGSDGCIRIYSPNHPFCTKDKYVVEHRLVAEKKLGRFLEPIEVVHHRNGKKSDNKWDNLFVFENNPEHIRFEFFLRRDIKKGRD